MQYRGRYRWDLTVNGIKTKVMKVARKRGSCEVRIEDQVIEQVDPEVMKHLGLMITSDGRLHGEGSGGKDCECYENDWRDE